MEIQLEIEPESPLSVRPVRPARYEGIPGTRVVVIEFQVEIEPESPLSVRPARYERIPGARQ